MKVDVLIIGGGVIGAAIARELARYDVDIALVEKEPDFGWGSTKANFGLVCQGGDTLEFRKGYKRTKLVLESIPLMEKLCKELDVPFRRIGKLSIIRNNVELARYEKMKERAEKAGDPIEPPVFIPREELFEMEPHITRDVIGALYDPMMSIVDPVRLAIALVENARENGVEVLNESEVVSIREKNGLFHVDTTSKAIETTFIINAAGLYADKVARLINADDFVFYPVKGVIGVLDKKVGDIIKHEIYALPTAPGEGNMVAPNVHGNILFGVTMRLSKRGDFSAPGDMIKKNFENLKKLIPDVSERDVINVFSGFFAFRNFEVGWHECVVRPSRRHPRFIHAVIGFPGVSAAPGTAKEVVRILKDQGLKLKEKEKFNPFRKDIPHFNELGDKEREELIKKDPRYGHIVCRCELVSEGEIVEAIKRGATTLDGIKFRTRAGMGRCQGGFCTPRLIRILSRELGIPEEKITKKGKGSELFPYKSKELLGES